MKILMVGKCQLANKDEKYIRKEKVSPSIHEVENKIRYHRQYGMRMLVLIKGNKGELHE